MNGHGTSQTMDFDWLYTTPYLPRLMARWVCLWCGVNIHHLPRTYKLFLMTFRMLPKYLAYLSWLKSVMELAIKSKFQL